MRPTAKTWPGWMETLRDDGATYRLTWDEWRSHLRGTLERGAARGGAPPPGRREIAARAFLLWFDDASSDRRDPPFDDREQAVRRFMRDFEHVATTLDQFS